MSYAHEDDRRGTLSTLRERLSFEIEDQTGKKFPIFQDRVDIEWGEQWRTRVKQSLDGATLLIAIITPRFFNSRECRNELEQFRDREQSLRRADLILPIHFIGDISLDKLAEESSDALVKLVAERQYVDWRKYRHAGFRSAESGQRVEALGIMIRKALKRAFESPAAEAVVFESEAVSNGDDTNGAPERSQAPQATNEQVPPTVLVVDPLGGADQTTIAGAIRAAPPAGRILVRAGVYRESLVVDKALEILGDGAPGTIVVESRDQSALKFQATLGRVANLTLKHTGGARAFGVEISQGRLDLEDCDISSEGFACVAVGGDAEPRLRRNRIHHGRQGGVYFYADADGLLEDNTVLANAFSGVEVVSGARATVRNNHIRDSGRNGIEVKDHGQAFVEGNEIAGNSWSGIAIDDTGTAIVRRNRVHRNRHNGVWIGEHGRATIEGNDLRDNRVEPVRIKGDPADRVVLERNQPQPV